MVREKSHKLLESTKRKEQIMKGTYAKVDNDREKTQQQKKVEKFQDNQRKRENHLVRVRLDDKTEVLTNNPEKYERQRVQ
mgnify:CR=1 FL=1